MRRKEPPPPAALQGRCESYEVAGERWWIPLQSGGSQGRWDDDTRAENPHILAGNVCIPEVAAPYHSIATIIVVAGLRGWMKKEEKAGNTASSAHDGCGCWGCWGAARTLPCFPVGSTVCGKHFGEDCQHKPIPPPLPSPLPQGNAAVHLEMQSPAAGGDAAVGVR